ncbi:MAG TPA: hypothetical protein VFA38_08020 [Nitrospirales bacterium]|nr:hypothetical protein [Nitrospirales bacterium]
MTLCYRPAMMVAAVFGTLLFVAMIVGDWWHFTSLSEPASDYGLTVARTHDRLPAVPCETVLGLFRTDGTLQLGHGIARLFRPQRRIVVRPQYHLFSLRFRTAWPLKGAIDLHAAGADTELRCRKLMPWSSAAMTVVWFLIVAGGTLSFLVSYAAQGGFGSLGGTIMGLGIAGLGVLVLAFGVLVVTVAYRLENHRLTAAYEELLDALGRSSV